MLKKLFIVVFFILCSQFFGAQVSAQSEPQVSGIVYGEDPVAMVGDDVIKVGDEIEGFKVEKIDPNSVTFRSKSGEEIIKKLVTTNDTKEALKTDKMKAYSERNSKTNDHVTDFDSQDLEQALAFLEQGKQLSHGSIVSVGLFNQVLVYFDKADTSLRYAFQRNASDEYRKKIKVVMSAVLDEKNRIRTGMRAFEEIIEKAKKDHRVVVGMTKADVTTAWGRAKQINSDSYSGNQSEQWVYGESATRAKYVYFDDGIVTSIQNR